MEYKKRNIEPKINKLLSFFPVVIILGTRQCGKTTLAQKCRPNWRYFDLENPSDYDRITRDPVLFFKEYPENIIIDEAQKGPELFSVLRGVIDKERSLNGRFILTGSSSFELLKNVSESLAGRVGLVELGPFKMNELKGDPFSRLYSLFEDEPNISKFKSLKGKYDISQIKSFILKGGYPAPALSEDRQFINLWMENYFETYLNRDIRNLHPKLDIIKYRRFISMLSFLSGTIINKSEIARSIETSEKTVRDYIDILSGTFFWRNLPSFKSSKIKNTLKLPIGFISDSGVALNLQQIDKIEKLENYPRLGKIFETFVIEEIIRGLKSTLVTNLEFYHFRTKAGMEIDFLIKGPFGLLPIEIKYSSYVQSKDLSPLRKFLKDHKLPLGLVINNSDQTELVEENILQIPVGAI